MKYITGGVTILETIIQYIEGMGVQNQWIWRTKQDINSKQCTIIWHVDDQNMSHIERKVIEDIIRQLSKKFGKESPLTTAKGKVLDYLGITQDYLTKGSVKISMYNYIDEMLTELPSDMNVSVKTPATSHLFNVDKDTTKFTKKTVQLFHHLVAKLLYLSRRMQQDIQTAAAFLCTWVQSPDKPPEPWH